METSQRRVLKAGEVKLQGSYRLGVNNAPVSRPVTAAHTQPQAPKAFIVEKNTEYAVIEVVCSCGSTMHVRCDYEPEMNKQ